MKILCCGDRHWSNYQAVLDHLSQYSKDTTVIYRDAKGADSCVDRAVSELGLIAQKLPAHWDDFGFTLDPMLDIMGKDLKPDLVVAFHNNLKSSRGTAAIVNEAKSRGIRVAVISAW